MIGPSKFVPIPRKSIIPVALSDGRMPCCCLVNGLVYNGMEMFESKTFSDYYL